MSTARDTRTEPTSLPEATQPSIPDLKTVDRVTLDLLTEMTRNYITLILTKSKTNRVHGFKVFGTTRRPDIGDKHVILELGEAPTLEDWGKSITDCGSLQESLASRMWSDMREKELDECECGLECKCQSECTEGFSKLWRCEPEACESHHGKILADYNNSSLVRYREGDELAEESAKESIMRSNELKALQSYIRSLAQRPLDLVDIPSRRAFREAGNIGYPRRRHPDFPTKVNVDETARRHIESLDKLVGASRGPNGVDKLRSLLKVPLKRDFVGSSDPWDTDSDSD